jgi:hypothetical protein
MVENSAKNGKNGHNKKKKRIGILWNLFSIVALLLVGSVTFALVAYEGPLLKKVIKENRAELLEELRKKRELEKTRGI